MSKFDRRKEAEELIEAVKKAFPEKNDEIIRKNLGYAHALMYKQAKK